ncbi:MAG: cobalamin-dependent protein [Maritimibacter sp.]|nr:cobalamin-dependent protein [Maritimibacter sp.]
MKITLISPKGPLYRHRGGIFGKSLRYQPLTLTTLSALVPPELGAEITLIDESIGEIPAALDADLVGMTVITGTAPRAYELSKRLRAVGVTVVLGGPHVTLNPEEAAAEADAIVVGYAEDTWPELLRDFAGGRMRARYDQAADFTLDQPVFPERDRFPKGKFLTQAVFEATRACAHACDFCVSPAAWGRRQYQKPVAHVVEDIRRTGTNKALFVDLNLVSDRRYAEALFTALVPLNIRWYGLATSLIGRDPGLMELMARSGCRGLLIGFETIAEAGLGAVRKGFNKPALYAQLIADLHRLGIAVNGTFVFGGDADTEDTFRETTDFVLETGIDLPRFAVLTPFPGTPLFARLETEGRIVTRDWELYDGQHVVFEPKGMSIRTLELGHEAAWKRVYSWGAVARRTLRAGRQAPLALTSNLGYRFYAHNLARFYTCDWPEMNSAYAAGAAA